MFKQRQAPAASDSLEKTADRLAQAVRLQWETEARVRRLNDPYPLPVGWEAAEAHLMEPWPLLRTVAESWPGGPLGDPASWASGPDGLAGQDGDIGLVFADRVPTRRLVVLGEPGAGKQCS